MKAPHQLDYAFPKMGRVHSRYAIAPVCMSVAVFLFSAVVLFWDDPFESMSNQKPIRIGTAAGILGIILAIGAMSDQTKKQSLAITGLVLNVLAILAAWLFLPYI
jgi:hypothetical protein